MTIFSPDYSPFWKHINWSDDPYVDRWMDLGIVRVQLLETLEPCGSADACVLGSQTKLPNGSPLKDETFKSRGIPTSEIIRVYDPMGQNFGGIGEWFDVRYRNDLEQYNPIGSKGLVRRVEVVDDELDASDKKGDFRVSRLDPTKSGPAGDIYNTDIKIEVNFEFFEKDLPKKYLIGDRFYAVFFHDSFDDGKSGTETKVDEEGEPILDDDGNPIIISTGKKFAEHTGRWELMPMGANVAVVGWVTDTIPAAEEQASGSKPGTTMGTNVRIQQLDDSDADPREWFFEDCLDGDGNIIEIRSFNICEVDIDSSQRIILDYIKGYPFVNCVCCPP